MKIKTLLILLITLLIFDIQASKYSENATYLIPFTQKNGQISGLSLLLSVDGYKFIASYTNQTTSRKQYQIISFDGEQLCKGIHSNSSQKPLYWSPANQPMFSFSDSPTIAVSKYICGNPVKLVTFPSPITGISFTSNSSSFYPQYYAAFATDNIISQYNLTESKLIKNFTINSTLGQIYGIKYSRQHALLFAWVGNNQLSKRQVLVLNATSGKEINRIENSIQPLLVLRDGGYIGKANKTQIYRIYKYGSTTNIMNLSQNTQEMAFCSDQDVIVLLNFYNQTQKYEIATYKSADGSFIQSFNLTFVPASKISCNDNYLAIFGTDSNIRIFKYQYEDPPLWVQILIISIFVLIIVGGCVGFMYCRKNGLIKSNHHHHAHDRKHLSKCQRLCICFIKLMWNGGHRKQSQHRHEHHRHDHHDHHNRHNKKESLLSQEINS